MTRSERNDFVPCRLGHGLDHRQNLQQIVEALHRVGPVGDRLAFECGTNRDLHADVRTGRFRDDLLSRISLWTFRLPGLRERREDIEPNVDYELDNYAQRTGQRVTFNKEARQLFTRFAQSQSAPWTNNFRDLNGAITRMATLAPGGRIAVDTVRDAVKSADCRVIRGMETEGLMSIQPRFSLPGRVRLELQGVSPTTFPEQRA